MPQSAQWSSSIIDPRAGAVDQISQQYTDDFHCHIHISTVGRITVLSSDARITQLNKTTINTTMIFIIKSIHSGRMTDLASDQRVVQLVKITSSTLMMFIAISIQE